MGAPGDLSGVVLDGRYRVIEPVAQGAMGVVYRAERIKLNRTVAIKVMHDSLPSELSSRERFEIEAMAMSQLDHPHCAAVLDVGVHDERPFVVMDFVDGDNLKDILEKRALPIVRVVEIMRQTLSGLAHAHELGIIHRDVKPANIILSQKAGLGDHVKVLDFGLARFANMKGPALTVGMVVGTPSYMAPEQCTGEKVDARTDLYACGVMMFELLTRQKPFVSANDDPVEVVRMHIQDAPPTLADATGREFGPELEAIVARALAKKPADRYPSAEAFAADLDVVRAQLISAPVRLPTPLPGALAPVPAPAPAPTASVRDSQIASERAVTAPTMSVRDSQIAAEHAAPVARPAGRPIPWLPLDRRRLAIAGGAAGLLLLIVIVAVAASGGGSKATPAAGPVATAPEPIEMPAVNGRDPEIDLVQRAQKLVDQGRVDPALDLVDKGRAVFPKNAQLAYMAGRLYFGKFYWSAGLKAFHDAIAADPSYRANAELIKTVLRGFITTPSYNSELAGFLRAEIGDGAKPYLQDTAANHPSAAIRARAANELRHYR